MQQKKLGVLFGGISPEHEVSIVTGVQLMKSVDREKYDLIPIYIDKSGKWWSGNSLTDMAWYQSQDLQAVDPNSTDVEPFSLKLEPNSNQIDVALLCFHGQYGEGGNVQGALELADIPYQGPGVTSSAACFDKILLRQILTAENLPQTAYRWFTAHQWKTQQQEIETMIAELTYPVFVKPANGGSTIGIQKVDQPQNLAEAVEVVLHYDDRILVETGITDCIEVNVSVLGHEADIKTSVPEQPINKDEFLSFADKYERGGGKKSGMASASRRIPAPISSSLTTKLQKIAEQVFTTFDCSGVIRIDFFANPSTEEIYIIEPNTIPGSMSYYLWEASDLPYPQLIDELVAIAQHQHHQKKQLTMSFESSILQKNTQ